VLCAPLVAGCGAVTREDFASHTRPASATDVSVYVGSAGIALDPSRLSPGPVEFNIANQSGKTVSVAVTVRNGAAVVRTPAIAAGGTTQIKTTLGHHDFAVGVVGRPSSSRPLTLSGQARHGDNELTQP
jgi:hypothetical protein